MRIAGWPIHTVPCLPTFGGIACLYLHASLLRHTPGTLGSGRGGRHRHRAGSSGGLSCIPRLHTTLPQVTRILAASYLQADRLILQGCVHFAICLFLVARVLSPHAHCVLEVHVFSIGRVARPPSGRRGKGKMLASWHDLGRSQTSANLNADVPNATMTAELAPHPLSPLVSSLPSLPCPPSPSSFDTARCLGVSRDRVRLTVYPRHRQRQPSQ